MVKCCRGVINQSPNFLPNPVLLRYISLLLRTALKVDELRAAYLPIMSACLLLWDTALQKERSNRVQTVESEREISRGLKKKECWPTR